MAQLPTYRKIGARTIQIDSVDVTGLKAGGQFYGNLNDRLDQLQGFISKKGTKFAKERATLDALNSPVTKDDLASAMANQNEAKSFTDSLFGGNIYEDTFNEVQGNMLANEMSLNAVEQLNIMKAKAETGQLDYTTAKAEIADMVDGYTAAISAFSPEAAKSARTSILSSSQTVLNSIGKYEIEQYRAIEDAKLEEYMLSVKRMAENDYAKGDIFTEETGYVSAEDVAQLKFKQLTDRATLMNKPQAIPKYYKVFREARINGVTKGVLSKEFAGSASEAMQRIDDNNLGPYQASWDKMTDEERGKVISKIYTETANKKKLVDDAVKVDKKKWQTIGYELLDQAYDAQTQEERDQIHAQMVEVNTELGTKFFSLKVLNDVKSGELDNDSADDLVVFELESTLYTDNPDDDFTLDDIRQLMRDKKISVKQGQQLIRKQETVRNRRATEALAYGKGIISEMPAFADPTTSKQAVGKINQNIIDAKRDPNDNRSLKDVVKDSVEEIQTSAWNTQFGNAQKRIAQSLQLSGIYNDQIAGMTEEQAMEFLMDKASKYLNEQLSESEFKKLGISSDYLGPIQRRKTNVLRLKP